jgi:hypothetical protein
VGGVGRDVAGLVVGVENEVHAGHVLILLALTDHTGKVGPAVGGRVDRLLEIAAILEVVNKGSNDRDTGNQVIGVFIDVFPGGHLVELAGVVEPAELGVLLQGKDADGEHDHRMAVPRQGADGVPHIGRDHLALFPLGQNLVNLGLCRDVAGQEEVPEGFNGRVLGVGGLGQRLKGLGDGLAAEADPFLGVEIGDIGDETTDVTRPTDRLVDGDLVDDYLAELLYELGGAGAELFNLLLERVFQCHLVTLLSWCVVCSEQREA